MKAKNLWIAVALLFVVEIILEFNARYFANSDELVISIIDWIAGLLTFFVFGLPLGLLMALVPYKGISFIEKFKKTLPISIALLMIFMICFTGYRIYLKKMKGIETRPGTHSQIYY